MALLRRVGAEGFSAFSEKITKKSGIALDKPSEILYNHYCCLPL